MTTVLKNNNRYVSSEIYMNYLKRKYYSCSDRRTVTKDS